MAKKLVNREMITVLCHVNDLKVSHKEPFEVNKCEIYLYYIYGNKLKAYRGKVHDQLGMYLDYSETEVVKV